MLRCDGAALGCASLLPVVRSEFSTARMLRTARSRLRPLHLSITHNFCAPENESQRDSDTQPRVAATLG